MRMDLIKIDSMDYEGKPLEEKKILSWFANENAYWVYKGEPCLENPHAELTSGLCSDGFFDCLRVLCYPNIAEILARRLVSRLMKIYPLLEIDYVLSSPYAAITFGYEVAKIIGTKFMFAEKDPADSKGKRMLWKRMTIPAGSTILQIEELITTSGTFQEVRKAVKEGNAEPVYFVPVVGVLVHRPPKLPADYGDVKVMALIEKEVRAFDPKDCPYCKVGSVRYRPKTHWAELTGKAV